MKDSYSTGIFSALDNHEDLGRVIVIGILGLLKNLLSALGMVRSRLQGKEVGRPLVYAFLFCICYGQT